MKRLLGKFFKFLIFFFYKSKALVDTKRRLDTVGALETQLAKQGRPSEDLNTIDEQIDNHRVGLVSYFTP